MGGAVVRRRDRTGKCMCMWMDHGRRIVRLFVVGAGALESLSSSNSSSSSGCHHADVMSSACRSVDRFKSASSRRRTGSMAVSLDARGRLRSNVKEGDVWLLASSEFVRDETDRSQRISTSVDSSR